MRKSFLYFCFLISSLAISNRTNAQEVYNEIKSNAVAAAANPSANKMIKEINQFKVDALEYLAIKMSEQMSDSTTTYLDKQAYAMNTFINYYIQTIIDNQDMPAAYQKKSLQLFFDISLSNPLFKDEDKDIVHAYLNSGSIMMFSLDTDWRIASAAVALEMKKLNSKVDK